MTEIVIEQRTTKWQELRRSLCLTSSQFGDALGIGWGKPYDFLRSIVESEGEADEANMHTQHGVHMEPIINDAYQLLTGNRTQPSGFWINEDGGPLHHLIGASPDAKVYGSDSADMIGLAEYKAPVYKIHGVPNSSALREAVPRPHMAQIQCQMAMCKMDWCDYMSLCTRTKEIALYRVYFEPNYWMHISGVIKEFCNTIQTARERRSNDLDPYAFKQANELKSKSMMSALFPGEDCIRVENMLTVSSEESSSGTPTHYFKSTAGTWMAYDFLVGEDPCEMELEQMY